jgi:hypothetical protein
MRGNHSLRIGILLIVGLLAACAPGTPLTVTPGPTAIAVQPTATPVQLPTNTAIPLIALHSATPVEPTARATTGSDPVLVAAQGDLGIVATQIPTHTPTRISPTATNTPRPQPQPVITAFSAAESSVDARAMANREALVTLTWAVDNRTAGTNLVFEQVFPDGMIHNVELPRHFTEVPSAGSGPVAPYLPGGDSTAITLRVRVISMTTGRTLATRDLNLPVVNRPAGSDYRVVAANACYDQPFAPSVGFDVGVRGIVSQGVTAELPVSAISGVGGQALGSLQRGETFTVTDGPFCFQLVADAEQTYRQWAVRSEATGLQGWVYEYSGSYRRLERYIGPFRGYVIYDPPNATPRPSCRIAGFRWGMARACMSR